MSAFNQNSNNNIPAFPNNQNFMYLPKLNNQLNEDKVIKISPKNNLRKRSKILINLENITRI